MLRKTILLILAIAVLPVFAQAPKVEESVRKFVQEFYSWYVPIAMKENDGPAFEIDQMSLARSSYMHSKKILPRKQNLLKILSALTGIPFSIARTPKITMNWEVSPRRMGSFRVDIHGVRSGARFKKPGVIAEVKQENGRWLFVNFHRTDGSNLLATLRLLKQSRKKAPH